MTRVQHNMGNNRSKPPGSQTASQLQLYGPGSFAPGAFNTALTMDDERPLYAFSQSSKAALEKLSVEDEIISINIGGFLYQTRASTLSRVPTSLLADPKRRQKFYDPASNSYFFDRNQHAFDAILEFYRTGKIIKPTAIPVYIFVREMLFFDLGDEMVDDFLRAEELLDEPVVLPTNKIQRVLFELFNCPDSSIYARLIAVLDIGLSLTAIIALGVLSLDAFQDYVPTNEHGNETMMHRKREYKENSFCNPFFSIDVICNSWFMLDVLVRFSVATDKRRFFLNFMTVVDVVTILPFLLDVIATAVTHDHYNGSSLQYFLAFRILKLFRIFKVLKMDEYSDGLKVLTNTIGAAQKELGIMALFLTVGAVFFATLIYYAERETINTDYTSVPASLWWAVITWTTIGYGDIFPKTLGGKIVGCICAITGVLALAFIIPPVVKRFEHYFYRAESMRELAIIYREHWARKKKKNEHLTLAPYSSNRRSSARDTFSLV